MTQTGQYQVHEFTQPGTYCGSTRDASLHTYATPTKMAGATCDWGTPYCRFMFIVEAQDRAVQRTRHLIL